MRDKLRKIRYRLRHDFLSLENVVLAVAIIMCLTWTYQSIMAMNRNWELTERLNTERRTLELLKVEVETAELENEYYQTEEYQELAARRMDKKLPGENMVILPENSEAAKNKHRTIAVTVETNTREYSNPEKWLSYLFP